MIVEIEKQKAIEKIERMAKFIVDRKMAPAALVTIESLRPLNFLSSQLLYFIAPFAEIIFNSKEYQEFAALLENDEYIELLVNRIDELDEEMYGKERHQRMLLKEKKRKRRKEFFKKIFKRNK